MTGRAKGLLFTYLRDWVVDTRGQGVWDEELAAAPSHVREVYDGIILASSWQPMKAWNGTVDSYFGNRYPDPNAGMAEFCAHLGERELTTLVRLVLKMGSPEFMLKRTGFLWKRYFSAGTFGAEEIDKGHWRLWLECSADPDHTAGPLTCTNGPAPWLERGMALAGADGTVRHVECRYSGSPRCEYVARWKSTK